MKIREKLRNGALKRSKTFENLQKVREKGIETFGKIEKFGCHKGTKTSAFAKASARQAKKIRR